MNTVGTVEIVRLAEVDSTSTHAATLLAQGKRPPFAVVAARQTGGRGRRGNAWQSPVGNLYMTLALPAPAEPQSQHGALPLKAGVLLARLLAAMAGVHVALKWPNDLFFAGKKLGGLLLESSTTGTKAGDVLVGIGLNLNVAPLLTAAASDGAPAEYAAISLRDILGVDQDPVVWAERLAQGLSETWQRLPLADVPAAFAACIPAAGAWWRQVSTGELWQATARVDGALELTGPAGQSTTLTSADHDFLWLPLLVAGGAPLYVADVGNTAVKLAVFELGHAQPAAVIRVANDAERGALGTALASLRQTVGADAASPTPLFLLTVRPTHAVRLTAAAQAGGFVVVPVGKQPVRYRPAAGGYVLSALGGDRLAAMEGALCGAPPDASLVVVQAGTATTVDVLTSGGEHRGGLIMPGLKTSLTALHQAAELLPSLAPEDGGQGPLDLGHDTAGAMQAGVRYAAVGAVRQAQQDAAAGRRPVRTVVTGGYAPLLADALGAPVLPDLVLQGIRAMVLGGAL